MYRRANGIKRLLACLIDILPIWAMTQIGYKLITGNSPMPENPWSELTLGRILVRDAWLPIWIVYGAIAECTPMRGTLGKLIMGLQVLGPHRRPVGFGRALGRNFAKILSAIPCYLGFFWAFFSERSKSWHDLISDTGVYERR